jgi:hypothetical protein
MLSIGNVDVIFDLKKVGGYLASSPTAHERDCLRQFVGKIRAGTESVPAKILGNQFLIAVCAHVLLVAFKGDKMYVRGIAKGVL